MVEIVSSWLKNPDFAVEVVKLIPSILWFILFLILLFLFYRPLRHELLPYLIGFKAMGIEVSFIRDSIEATIELAEKTPEWGIEISPIDKERVIHRVKKNVKMFKNVQILWVDDEPENTFNERKMFRQLDVQIDISKSTKEALKILAKGRYDLVISDIARSNEAVEATAGLEFLKEFRKMDKTTPVIFYVGAFEPEKGAPSGSFGITNRPDELLHLTLDCLERKKN